MSLVISVLQAQICGLPLTAAIKEGNPFVAEKGLGVKMDKASGQPCDEFLGLVYVKFGYYLECIYVLLMA